MNRIIKVMTFIFLFVIAGISCQKLLPPAPADDEILDGPLAELTPEQNAIFIKAILLLMMKYLLLKQGWGHCL